MKNSGFKNKHSVLKKNTSLSSKKGFKKSTISFKKRSKLNKFREITGPLLDGEKILTVPEADASFSKEVRMRDRRCLNCGSKYFLTCSHFFGRSKYNTRFDLENCITLCTICHDSWETKKNGVYKDFMIFLLGEEGYSKLEERANIKIAPYEAITNYMKSVGFNNKNKDIEY